jgi:hypothetical protein
MNRTLKDLQYVKEEFKRGSAFVIARDETVLAESREKGVAPFFRAVNKLEMHGAVVADRIVGKAVAFLCVYAGISAVYTPLVSDPAGDVLQEYTVHLEADTKVPMILNARKDDQCPVEKLILTCTTPQEAYTVLQKKFEG